jgi:hypothetical protein
MRVVSLVSRLAQLIYILHLHRVTGIELLVMSRIICVLVSSLRLTTFCLLGRSSLIKFTFITGRQELV